MPEMYELRQMQSPPLEAKAAKSLQRIREWYEYWDGNVYVSFSGGKDSTVLLHLVRSIYPDVPAVFVNTGLEFPEIVRFVKETPNVTILRPKMAFNQVIETYGWPVISKVAALYIRQIRTTKSERLRLSRLWGNRPNSRCKLAEKWHYLVGAPFLISEQCCDVMKKRPMRLYERSSKAKPFIGSMASDGYNRQAKYLDNGCNAFDIKHPASMPMGFWLEDDVWEYIRSRSLAYCSIYDMGYTRTGCVFCCFGLHMEGHPNRFERMAVTHPKLYDYCMGKLGLGKVLDYMGINMLQPEFLEMMVKKDCGVK